MKYTDESSLPQLTDEEFNQELTKVRPYTVCILKAGPSFERPRPDVQSDVTRVIWQHGKRNVALHRAGLMPIVCPIGDGGEITGVSIFALTPDEVERVMAEDPGVKAGVFTYEIHACRSFPGSSLP